jgi:hypothetical protein
MRTLRDLDDEIARAERRLAARREHLTESLQHSRARTRVSLASPKVLAAAFVVGFGLERLSRLRSRGSRQQPRKGSSASGIVAGLAAAALRAAIGNPKVWETVRNAWSRRGAQPARRASAAEVAAALRHRAKAAAQSAGNGAARLADAEVVQSARAHAYEAVARADAMHR